MSRSPVIFDTVSSRQEVRCAVEHELVKRLGDHPVSLITMGYLEYDAAWGTDERVLAFHVQRVLPCSTSTPLIVCYCGPRAFTVTTECGGFARRFIGSPEQLTLRVLVGGVYVIESAARCIYGNDRPELFAAIRHAIHFVVSVVVDTRNEFNRDGFRLLCLAGLRHALLCREEGDVSYVVPSKCDSAFPSIHPSAVSRVHARAWQALRFSNVTPLSWHVDAASTDWRQIALRQSIIEVFVQSQK